MVEVSSGQAAVDVRSPHFVPQAVVERWDTDVHRERVPLLEGDEILQRDPPGSGSDGVRVAVDTSGGEPSVSFDRTLADDGRGQCRESGGVGGPYMVGAQRWGMFL